MKARSMAHGIVKRRLVATPAPPSAGASIALSWDDDATNETGYLVRMSLDNSSWVTLTTLAAGSTGYTATGLTDNTAHYFEVSAVNGSGNQPPVQIGPYYTPRGHALANPYITLIDPNTVSANTTAPSDEPANGGYQVDYYAEVEPEWTHTVTSPTRPVEMGGLTPDMRYSFRIRTYSNNSDGTRSLSPVSVIFTATTLGYSGLIASFNPLFYARLGEISGIIAGNEAGADGDYLPNDTTDWTGGTFGIEGALVGDSATCATFNRATPGYADFGNLTSLNGLSTFTLLAWVKPKAFAGNNYAGILRKPVDATSGLEIGLGGPGVGNSTRIYLALRNGSECIVNTDTDLILDPNIWYFVAVLFNGAGATNTDRIKVYINMVEDSVNFNGYIVPSVSPSNSASVTLGRDLDGSLDEVCVIPSVLTVPQLTTIYNASGRIS